MKPLYLILFCIAFIFFSCSRNNTNPLDDILQVDKEAITLSAAASAADTIKIVSNTEWSITIPQNITWLKVEPTTGSGNGSVVISTIESNTDSIRSVEVNIKTKSGTKSLSIAVTQSAISDSIIIAQFGDDGLTDVLNGFIETPEGDLIAVGTSFSLSGNIGTPIGVSSQCWAIRIDKEGNKKWSRFFGSGSGIGIAKSTGDNYLILATAMAEKATMSDDSRGDSWLLAIDGNGNVLWEKQHGGTGADQATFINALKDGNFVFGGLTSSVDHDITENHGGDDAWLVKINAQGDIIWSKTYGNLYTNYFYALTTTSDGGFIFSGSTYVPEGQGAYGIGWYGKISGDGTLEWTDSVAFRGTSLTAVVETSDGEYLFGGSTNSSDVNADRFHGDYDAFLIRTDVSGNIAWKKAYGGTARDRLYDLMESTDHRLIISGITYSKDGDITENSGKGDAFVMDIDANGNPIHTKTIGGLDNDDAFQILEMKSGRFAFIGESSSYSQSSQDKDNGWFVIFDF